ncbi:MAG: ABC transporter permease [Solirubrobacteraceae bacterium]
MNDGLVVQLLASAVLFGTPLLIAALGELLAERSGVLNLGVEGMMLVGAVCGFWTSQKVGGSSFTALLMAVVVAGVVGGGMGLIHALMTVTLRANQIVSGLALTIFGGAIGLSSYIGDSQNLTGQTARHEFGAIDVFGLADVPVLGPILFHHPLYVYGSWVLVIAVAYYLYRTRAGLHLQAVGEDPAAADAMGINVTRYRYAHTVAGGVFAGLAGSFYTLALAGNWSNGITAGAGWIALAMVVLAFWRPELVVVGAYLFGGVAALGPNLQARDVPLPPELFSALPYLMTIVVLVLVSSAWARGRLGAPGALGTAYTRGE